MVHRLFICLSLFFLSSCTFAGWQVVKPNTCVPREPFFQASRHTRTPVAPKPMAFRRSVPGQYINGGRPAVLARPAPVPFRNAVVAGRPVSVALRREPLPYQYVNVTRPTAVYAVSISGSLKENIERIMGRYHWKVVWKAPYDYNFDGRVTGTSLPNVVDKLFKPFPLQAVMYMSNRTIAIVPRYRT